CTPCATTTRYDAIALTADYLDTNRPGDPRRRAVIVFTDGLDTSSELTPKSVAEIPAAIDVPVYVMTVISDMERDTESQSLLAETPLRDLARATGGDLF